jgi:hypothetical protein
MNNKDKCKCEKPWVMKKEITHTPKGCFWENGDEYLGVKDFGPTVNVDLGKKTIEVKENLSKQEFIKVTETFLERLEKALCNAGCNDLFDDEWPQSVIDKFDDDTELFNAWRNTLYMVLDSLGVGEELS